MIVRQIVADLRWNKGPNVLLWLACSMAASIMAIAGGLATGSGETFDRTDEILNGADRYLISRRQPLERLAANPSVTEATPIVPATAAVANVNGTRWEVVALGWDEPPKLGTPAVLDGTFPTEPSHVLVDQRFMGAAGLEVGDPVTLESPGVAREYTISGSMLYIGTQRFPGDSPRIIVSSAEVLTLTGDPDWHVALNLAPGVTTGDLMPAADRSGLVGDARETIKPDFIETTSAQRVVLTALGVLAVLVAGLTVANLIGGRLLAKRRRISLQKAIGWKPRQLLAVYLGQTLFIVGLGIATGFASGALVAPQISRSQNQLLASPSTIGLSVTWLIGATLAIGSIAVLAVVLALVGPLRNPAAAAMQSATTKPPRTRWRVGNRVPVTFRLALKDAFRPVGRTIVLIASLAIAAATLSATLYFDALIANINPETQLDFNNNRVAVGGSMPLDDLAALLDQTDSVLRWEYLDRFMTPYGSNENLRHGAGVELVPGGTAQQLDRSLRQTSGDTVGVITDTNADLQLLNEVLVVTQPISMLLLAAALATLASTTYLHLHERRRELGILKAIGTRPSGLTGIVLLAALVPAVVGSTIGLAVGGLLLRVLLLVAGADDGSTFVATPDLRLMIGAGVLLLTTALLACLPVAIRATRSAPALTLGQVG